MADNNAFNAQGAGLTSQTTPIDNSLNNNRNKNSYDMSYNLYTTSRFGMLEPSMFYDAIEGESVTFRSAHQLRTYTLESPLLNGIQMREDNFKVPYAAILEHGWSCIKTNPVSGSDIDFTFVNSLISPYELASCLNRFLISYYKAAHPSTTITPTFGTLYSFFSCLSFMDSVMSGTGLVKLAEIELDFKLHSQTDTSNTSLIDWNDHLYAYVQKLKELKDDTSTGLKTTLVITDNSLGFNYRFDLSTVPGMRRLFEFFQNEFIYGTSTPNYGFTVDGDSSAQAIPSLIRPFFEILGYTAPSNNDTYIYTSWLAVPSSGDYEPSKYLVNIYRLIAYQLVCAQFYTNDYIDPLNTAHKWHNNMMSFVRKYGIQIQFFNHSGVDILYDSISRRYSMGFFLSSLDTSPKSIWYSYMFNIFGFQRALKFGDYFTTSKSRPYAVGNSEIVTNTNVNGLDLTRSLLIQRFLNAVNRIGNNALEYAKRMGGTLPTTRDAQPYFLSSTTYNIDGFEVENTSENQGNVTTNLKSFDNRFAFETFCDEDCVLVGIRYIVCRPCYFNSTNRHNSHIERFDYFTPMLQDLGNVSLGLREIEPIECPGSLAYKPVYSEYRETRDVATGSFARSNLKSWVLDTPVIPHDVERIACPVGSIITPNFYRYRSSDFDRFYSSLTGIGADYYHFIMRVTNYISSKKPISDNPKLLF